MATTDTRQAFPSTNHLVEMLVFLQQETSADADRVIGFLRLIGFPFSKKNPISLPPDFLRTLATALRLIEWERLGFTLHLEQGLPSGQQVLDHVFNVAPLPASAPDKEKLDAKVGLLALAHFAWQARRQVGATVALDLLVEDSALETVAEFLWTHRHSLRQQDPNRGV